MTRTIVALLVVWVLTAVVVAALGVVVREVEAVSAPEKLVLAATGPLYEIMRQASYLPRNSRTRKVIEDAASSEIASLARESGKPLLCDNCGKAMAAHGAGAECYRTDPTP